MKSDTLFENVPSLFNNSLLIVAYELCFSMSFILIMLLFLLSLAFLGLMVPVPREIFGWSPLQLHSSLSTAAVLKALILLIGMALGLFPFNTSLLIKAAVGIVTGTPTTDGCMVCLLKYLYAFVLLLLCYDFGFTNCLTLAKLTCCPSCMESVKGSSSWVTLILALGYEPSEVTACKVDGIETTRFSS